jgi:hypothetical protein
MPLPRRQATHRLVSAAAGGALAGDPARLGAGPAITGSGSSALLRIMEPEAAFRVFGVAYRGPATRAAEPRG